MGLRQRLAAVAQVVNPAGWVIGALALASLLATWVFHWREFAVVALGAVVVLLLCLPFLLGRTRVRIDVSLQPQRVTAGQSAAAAVHVTNLASRRLVPTLLELPVGAATHRYGVPALLPGATHEEIFTLRTERRGVIEVGPAITRRGDPLGAFSRDVAWTGVTEVLVRPPLVALESLGAGLLRDLEGVSTDAVSQSDLAFHALREYVPGDDLRHVHWRSSAKAMAASAANQLLVRQYLDTRRSHATIVVDDRAESWADPEDFETALAVAGSIAVRAVLDEFETSFVCGPFASTGADGNQALDAVCRAVPGDHGLVDSGRRALDLAPDTSLVFIVSGAHVAFDEFQRAVAPFSPEVRRFGMIVDGSTRSRVTEAGGLPVVELAKASDLGAVLRWSVR